MAQPVHFKATVSEVVTHSEDVYSYTLVSEKRLPTFLPGQFIHLSLELYNPSTFWPESRVFSVANAVFDRKTIKLVISKHGIYTRRIINELKVDSIVSCKGPYGDFVIRNEAIRDRQIVLIAGGTGITPFSAFMEALLEQNSPVFLKCLLFYGARTSDLLIYKKLADACSSKFNNFIPVYFAENTSLGKNLSLDIKRGRLNVESVVNAIQHDRQTLFYLSGPRLMIDYFSHELGSVFQHSAQNILIDAW